MGAKGKIPGWVWFFGVIALTALLADASSGVWILLGIGCFLYLVVEGSRRPKESISSAPSHSPGKSPPQRSNQSSSLVVEAAREHRESYRIPAPPQGSNIRARWLSRDEAIEVEGVQIAGGLIYVGSGLKGANGRLEPALIDPTKPVARAKVSFTEKLTSYWPSYSECSPEARRAYLLWLADERKDPRVDMGYVFLYFYGLERRAIYDAQSDPTAEAEKPIIAAELRRLLAIYGRLSHSFQGYASKLLQFIDLSEVSGKSYEQQFSFLDDSYELPYPLRLALGQAAVDGVPVPAHLALAWAEHDPLITRRMPVTRCQEEFRKLFVLKYRKKHGDGMKLTVNRTKLKLSYLPASSGLTGFSGGINLRFGDIPDVSALTGPPKKLQAIVDECTIDLDAYSRLLGRSPEKRDTLEAILQLPPQLWSDAVREIFGSLKKRVLTDMVEMTLEELCQLFGSADVPNRERVLGLVKVLEIEDIGIEPDLLGGAKMPKPEETLILFHGEPAPIESRNTAAYKSALVMLELAAGVAAADGDFSAVEVEHINGNIDSWLHLTPSSQRRLKARLKLLKVAPVSLAALKKKVEPLDAPTKEAIASFTATLVQVDGMVSPAEVKFLEKVYKLLGVDVQKVYSDVHAAVTTDVVPVLGKVAETASSSFTLDPVRIAALQKDSARVAAMLSEIFTDEEPVVPPVAIEVVAAEELSVAVRILGLDEVHSAFARLLMSRLSWERDELNDLALDLDLMLDGALERVNEAALDTLDIPFTEGDDPIEVHPEINEKVKP